MSLVKFENFYDEATLAGNRTGRFVVVSRTENRDALDRWIDYCGRKADESGDRRWADRAAFFRKLVETGQGMTMPCFDPADFDPGVYRGKPYAPPVRQSKPSWGKSDDGERRREVVAQWRTRREVSDTARSARPAVRRSPTYREQPETPEERLARLAEDMRAPLAQSPALVSSWGKGDAA